MADAAETVSEVISEQFGFAPLAFTRKAEDLANAVIYNVMEAVEKDMTRRLGDGDAVKKALVSLETLLESSVDKKFDLFEAFCFRNVFDLKPELLPYIRLEHHPADGYPADIRGSDTALLAEWTRERDAADEAVVQAAAVRAARARIDRRLAALARLRGEVDALTGGRDAVALRQAFEPLPSAVAALDADATALLARQRLTQIAKPTADSGGETWQTREGYLQWAARKGTAGRMAGSVARLEADIRHLGSEQEVLVRQQARLRRLALISTGQGLLRQLDERTSSEEV